MNLFKSGLRQGFAVLGGLIMISPVAMANDRLEQIQELEQYAPASTLKGQVTSVNQLSDVEPTSWAYEALRSLVERYGCIVGYPDRTYRGNRALSRWEFAAGLNACLNTIERLIQDNVSILKEDLDKLTKLAKEFETELAVLGTKVDNLEQRVAFLEDHQFSTTTKLKGQVLFAVGGAFGDNKANSNEDLDSQIFFSDRVRLLFNTSFSGKDLLLIRLQAGNTPDLKDATGTRMTRFAFTDDNNNNVRINQLEYRFPLGDKGTVFLEAFGFLDLFVPTLHPLDGDYNTVISGFSLRSPIYFQSGLTGVGFNYNFTKQIAIGGGYLAGDPTAGNPNTGLFNGPYGALAQLTIRPIEQLGIAFTYVNGYDNGSGNAPPGGFFGSENATFPFGEVPVAYNSYGVEAEFRFTPQIALSGWFGWTDAESKGGTYRGKDADITYWAVTLSLFDLFKEGNLAGLIFGQPSKVTNNDVGALEDKDTSYLIEAFYRYQITNNISLTPGLVVVTSPEHNSDNDTDYIGVIRTVFDF